MVDLAKLKFFQTRLTRDLISGAMPDPTALSNRILKPIQSALEQLSQDLSKNPSSELVAEVVGAKPQMHISTVRESKQHTEEYIHEVLKASKGSMDNHHQFIRDNLYAFWPPSTLAYKNSFNEFTSGMNRVKMVRKKDKIVNVDISKVLLYFRNSLDALPEEEWNLDNVGNKAKELADSVTYYNTEKDTFMEHGAGWKFLRWSLLVGMPGLSVVPVMMLLGREETLKRLRSARKCAVVQEEKLAVAARKAAKLQNLSFLHTQVMGHSAGKGQKSPDDQVSEPRNLRVPIREEEPTGTQDKAKGFLRPMHHESHLPEKGPFVSQPRPQFVPDQKPEDRLLKRFLSPEEFKDGYRHVLGKEQSEPADKHPSRKRTGKRTEERAKHKAARKPKPAEEISPFEPGGSFFAPEAESGTSFRQTENTYPQGSTPHRPDRPRHSQKPAPPDTSPAPFLQGMSDDERRSHVGRLMAQKTEEQTRQALAARRLVPGEPQSLYPVEQPGGTSGDVPSGFGPLFAGKPVLNHPVRLRANEILARGAESEGVPQGAVDKGHDAAVAELEQGPMKESWANPRHSRKPEDSGR